jgi:hypothetical protein
VNRARAWLLAAVVTVAMPAFAQSIYKCKGTDGRITYSSLPCAGEGVTLPIAAQGQPPAASTTPPPAAAAPPAGSAPSNDAAAPAPVYRPRLPKQCDNAASLRFVVARLDSPATPDDIRGFLADERFRLVRCEFTRFSAEERRERDAAMRDLEARDAARRQAAIARIEALYDRYLNPSERVARARNRQR